MFVLETSPFPGAQLARTPALPALVSAGMPWARTETPTSPRKVVLTAGS